jgi:15-cis-phytoene synthase
MTSDIQYCRASIARHSKSFALAARLLPAPTADEAAIVYSWCRRADDAVDMAFPRTNGRRRSSCSAARSLPSTPASGRWIRRAARLPAASLASGTSRESIPRSCSHGMQMDIERDRYACLDDLLVYCFRVAGTVG